MVKSNIYYPDFSILDCDTGWPWRFYERAGSWKTEMLSYNDDDDDDDDNNNNNNNNN